MLENLLYFKLYLTDWIVKDVIHNQVKLQYNSVKELLMFKWVVSW